MPMSNSQLATYNVLLLQESSAASYPTWTDLEAGLTAENNGITKTGSGVWDVGRTVEVMASGGGIKVSSNTGITDKSFILQLFDSTQLTGTDVLEPSGLYSLYHAAGNIKYRAYYNGTELNNNVSAIVSGQSFELRENGGAIEALIDDTVQYTWAASPAASLAGRIAVLTAGTWSIAPIEFTGGAWS